MLLGVADVSLFPFRFLFLFIGEPANLFLIFSIHLIIAPALHEKTRKPSTLPSNTALFSFSFHSPARAPEDDEREERDGLNPKKQRQLHSQISSTSNNFTKEKRNLRLSLCF